MNFIEKYKRLSNKYSSQDRKEEERLLDLDLVVVIDMIEDLGYPVSIFNDNKERFLKIEEVMQEGLVFGVHLDFEFGKVELIWNAKRNGKVRLGSPWSIYSRFLIDPNYRIKMPAFRDYDELEGILKESFEMYEEFKAILIKEYANNFTANN